MEKGIETSNFKLGIITGGQLGKMLIQEASKWAIDTAVLDNDEECPARAIATHYVKGSHLDFDAVYQFGKTVDLLTFEIESINVEALKKLKSEGVNIQPDPYILELIQDKGLQKQFYSQNSIPTSDYTLYETDTAIQEAIQKGELHFPFVQKLRKGGYDGRGVAVVNGPDDLNKILPGASLVEHKVEIFKEISVIVARNKDGQVMCYPVVEMVFDHKANLVDKLVCPSTITDEQSEKALRIASEIITLMDMQGLLAVEFFIDSKGEVLVNEMAPRTHNSGHHSIESIVTSQFEQHLRAILNLPLGSTQQMMPAVMVNVLGAEGYEGPVLYEGIRECMAIDGVNIHLYVKKITKPYRKMGHVTIVSDTIERALEKAEIVQKLICVKSWKKN